MKEDATRPPTANEKNEIVVHSGGPVLFYGLLLNGEQETYEAARAMHVAHNRRKKLGAPYPANTPTTACMLYDYVRDCWPSLKAVSLDVDRTEAPAPVAIAVVLCQNDGTPYFHSTDYAGGYLGEDLGATDDSDGGGISQLRGLADVLSVELTDDEQNVGWHLFVGGR